MTATSQTFTSGSTPFLSGSPYTPEPGTSDQKKFRPEPTYKDLEQMMKKMGMPMDESTKEIYMNAIKGIHQAAEFTLSQPDYIPHTHTPTYPRTNIHFPTSPEELELGWAYKATVRKEPPVEFVEEDDVDSHEEQAVLNMTHTVEDVFTKEDKHAAGEDARKGEEAKPSGQGNAKPLHNGDETPKRKTRRREPLIRDRRVTIKDMVMLKDVPCLFGSEVQDEGEYISDMDATCVTRILDEGGVILGKANCEMSLFRCIHFRDPDADIPTSSALSRFPLSRFPQMVEDNTHGLGTGYHAQHLARSSRTPMPKASRLVAHLRDVRHWFAQIRSIWLSEVIRVEVSES